MIFNTLNATALEGVEKIINTALRYDPASKQELLALEGQILLVDSVLPAFHIALEPCPHGIKLHQNWQQGASVTIRGSLVALANMALEARNAENSASLSDTGVQLCGNLETVRRLNNILSNLDIDWEAALAQLCGDIPAHLLCESIRSSASFHANAVQRTLSTITEASQEELQLVPSRNEYHQFAQSVRYLATDTDRLIAKTNQLRRLIEQQSGENLNR